MVRDLQTRSMAGVEKQRFLGMCSRNPILIYFMGFYFRKQGLTDQTYLWTNPSTCVSRTLDLNADLIVV
jgi:hypothetical protein